MKLFVSSFRLPLGIFVTAALSTLVACSDDGGGSTTAGPAPSSASPSSPSSGDSCDAIESDYLLSATASSATTCASVSECTTEFGLCKSSGARVIGNAKAVYNSATAEKLTKLAADWKARSCGKSACEGSAGGTLGCESGKCVAR